MASEFPSTARFAGKARLREATGGFRRDRISWTCYLALALFTYFRNIQGNIIPFLRDELALSYREVSLHPAALAAGLIVCGLFGERAVAWCGRRSALALGFVGVCGGAVLLSLAHTAAASIAGCLLMGAPGGLILVVAPAVLAERHGADRSIALAEANAGSYIASLTAAVATGLFTAIGLDWRNGLALGIALAAVVLARNLGDPILAARPRGESGAGRLPAAYWAYWATLFCVIALEYCTLLWSPEVLERVQGLSARLRGRHGRRLFRRDADRAAIRRAAATARLGATAVSRLAGADPAGNCALRWRTPAGIKCCRTGRAGAWDRAALSADPRLRHWRGRPARGGRECSRLAGLWRGDPYHADGARHARRRAGAPACLPVPPGPAAGRRLVLCRGPRAGVPPPPSERGRAETEARL